LADSGQIRYIDDKKESYRYIGLGSPLIYLQLASRGKFDINLDETAALKFPQGKSNEEIAENLTLRYLTQKAKCFLKTVDQNFEIKDTNVEKLVLRTEYNNF